MLSIQAWLQLHSPLSTHVKDPISFNQLRLLLEHSLQKNRAWIFAHPEQPLTESQISQLNQWVEALKSGQPLAYLTGEQAFWDLTLKVNSHTLIPRPDSEILIETAIELLANNSPSRILDLGTGSGALALVLAKQFPNSSVLAVDNSAEALAVANNNAVLNNIHNIQFQQSEWFDQIPAVKYDLIVSNPPYIDVDDEHLDNLTHEPITALVADNNGLAAYQAICAAASAYLQPGGLLMFEHGWQQRLQVQDIMQGFGFKNMGSRKDLMGNDRVIFAFN